MSLIRCSFIENVEWIDSFNNFALLKDETHIWRINHAAFQSRLEYFKTVLNEEELIKASRFKTATIQHNYIISHAALRIILSKYIGESPSAIQFTEGENKKPQLAAGHKLFQFNLSHSHECSLIAVSKNEVGADIEYINKTFSYNDIAKSFFNKDEIEFIQSAHNQTESFYTCWTRKEALLKAISSGLTNNISNIPCLNGKHFADNAIIKNDGLIKTFNVANEYIGSIALHALNSSIKFFDFIL